MDKSSKTYGRFAGGRTPTRRAAQWRNTNFEGNMPGGAIWNKGGNKTAYSPGYPEFYVPTNHVCMDMQPYR